MTIQVTQPKYETKTEIAEGVFYAATIDYRKVFITKGDDIKVIQRKNEWSHELKATVWSAPQIQGSFLVDCTGVTEVVTSIQLAQAIATDMENFATDPITWLQRHGILEEEITQPEASEEEQEVSTASPTDLTPAQQKVLSDLQHNYPGSFHGHDGSGNLFIEDVGHKRLVCVRKDGVLVDVEQKPTGDWIAAKSGVKNSDFWFTFDEVRQVNLKNVTVRSWRQYKGNKFIGWGKPEVSCSGWQDKTANEMFEIQEQVILATKIAADFKNFVADPVAWLQSVRTV